MPDAIPQPSPAGHLDVLLAESVLQGGLRGQRLLEARRARDHRWIIGVLGCRGVHVTVEDVDASLTGRPGRFLPGQPAWELVRGLRQTIDELEKRAETGQTPTGEGVVGLYEGLTAGLRRGQPALREGAPREQIDGLLYPGAVELPALLAACTEQAGYLGELRLYQRLHPVVQAAWLFRNLVRVSPFPDHNFTAAALAASWLLLAKGYPPFLPQAMDRTPMEQAVIGSFRQCAECFAQVVLVGYCASAA